MSPTNDTLTPVPSTGSPSVCGRWATPGGIRSAARRANRWIPVDSVKRLGELGAWGVSLHDEDLIPWGTPAAERDRIVARFKAALDEAGMGVGMGTTNLFGHPAFKDGAFTSNDRARPPRRDRQVDDRRSTSRPS